MNLPLGKAHLKNTHIWADVPTGGVGWLNQIPTNLTYFASDKDKLPKLQNKLSIKNNPNIMATFELE